MAESNLRRINSILLLDDDPDGLRMVSEMLSHRFSLEPTRTRFPSEAVRLANERFFDLIFLDVTIEHRGSPFGGLDVYGELLPRYGSESLIAYSEIVTDSVLRRYPFVDNFVDKHTDPIIFAHKLTEVGLSLRDRQSCFVAMPFSDAYDDLYRTIELAIVRAGFRPVRVDRQEFTSSIIERVLHEIRRSKLVLFVASDRNPNAFYECGYAVALNKEVITVSDDLSSLPFDVRDRNAISYDSRVDLLANDLVKRLSGLTRFR